MKNITSLLTLGAVVACFGTAQAVTISGPSYDSFGLLPGANFGGSGIPNTSVAVTEVDFARLGGTGSATIGLTAHQRFSNSPPTNDGAGSFAVEAGGDDLNGSPGLARWNIGLYGVFDSNVSNPFDYSWEFVYDTDPGGSDPMDDIGTSLSVTSLLPTVAGNSFQDSQNLGFGFFDFFGNTNGVDFDPTADGEYRFALRLLDGNGEELGRSAIFVDANSASVPEGGSILGLFGMSLLGLAGFRRFLGKRV